MKIRYIYTMLIALFAMAAANAQQDPNYTFYRYNMNLINPAYAGAGEHTEVGLDVRSQWANVQGAPETQSLFFGTPMGKNVGLGVSIINDKTFIESQVWLALDFSYRLQISDGTNLFFGIKAGVNSYKANTDGLITYGIQSDPSLMDIKGSFNPNIGTGIYLRSNAFFASLSAPKILSLDRLEDDNGLAKLRKDRVQLYAAAGYDFILSGDMILKPSAIVRYVDSAPISVNLTTALTLGERFEVGGAYRLNEGIGGFFIFKVSEWLNLGYAYESAFERPVTNLDNGTHEILFNLKL